MMAAGPRVSLGACMSLPSSHRQAGMVRWRCLEMNEHVRCSL